ncbi:MAG TPA: hypothetical protein DEP72_06510 [Clostridiales bacterium]|nr:MAG: hypothetical protein A2Y18_03590 [Clostridiales bacterium GWD2_32_19]HCC07790.1 hypothetical protein [Clostridiales bacterium]
MQICHKEEAEKFENASTCMVYEYGKISDNDINGAVGIINGRYPEEGLVTNEECKELVYVIKGEGKIVITDVEHKLKEGTMILIDKGEKYFFEGQMEILMPCTPAWYPEQHKEII